MGTLEAFNRALAEGFITQVSTDLVCLLSLEDVVRFYTEF